MDNNALTHYGVLGMKWGVRRSQAELDRAAGRKSDKAEKSRQRKIAAGKTIMKASAKTRALARAVVNETLFNKELQAEFRKEQAFKRELAAAKKEAATLAKEKAKTERIRNALIAADKEVARLESETRRATGRDERAKKVLEQLLNDYGSQRVEIARQLSNLDKKK